MSAIFNQVLFHWVDTGGKTAVSFASAQDQSAGGAAAYAPLAGAAQACADAALVAVQFQSTLIIGAAPLDGPYCTVFDRAVMFDKNPTTGVLQRQAIVGPKSGIFLPGNIQVDLTNSAVIAFKGQVQALLGDMHGNPCGPFLRGKRQEAGPA